MKLETGLVLGGVAVVAYAAWRAVNIIPQIPGEIANETSAAAGAVGDIFSFSASQAVTSFGTPTTTFVSAAAGDTFNPIDDTWNFITSMFSNGVSFGKGLASTAWADAQKAAALQ